MEIPAKESLAQALTHAIQTGDVETLGKLLDDDSQISKARIVDSKGASRTLLHVAVDWPGHFRNVAQTIELLIERGAEADAPMVGGNAPETPLHWAASSNDVDALNALLDGGANIESPGAIFTNGTAMSDAVIFAQWNAARRLLDRGARTTLTESAALGLMDRLVSYFEQLPEPASDQITAALWHACRGGQLQAAEYLSGKGANINWVGWDKIAPLDGALQSGNQDLTRLRLRPTRCMALSDDIADNPRVGPGRAENRKPVPSLDRKAVGDPEGPVSAGAENERTTHRRRSAERSRDAGGRRNRPDVPECLRPAIAA